jgi:hypothetical protein
VLEGGPRCRRQRFGAGLDRDQARCDLGWRDEGARRHVEQDARLGNPLEQYRKPSIGFAARCGNEALGDFALKHQGQALIFADLIDPADEERGGDVVGKVGDDLAGRPRERHQVEVEGVGSDDFEALGIGSGKLGKCRETAPVALDRDDPAGAAGEQCPCQTAGTGADLDYRRVVEPTCRPRNPTRQIEIEQEILTEALVSDNPVTRDDLAQRRQRGRGRVGRRGFARIPQPADARLTAISAASRNAAIRLSARAIPRPAIAKAVPWSGEVRTNGNPSVIFTPPWKSIVLIGISA